MIEQIRQNYNQETQHENLDPELELLDMVAYSLEKNIANRLDDRTENNLDIQTEDGWNNEVEDDLDDQIEEEPDFDETERIEFREDHLKINRYPLNNEINERFPFLRELPEGVAVMGGVARSIARQVLTGDIEPIRDIDLVNITDRQGAVPIDMEKRTELSKKYMPEDFAYGHGIQDDTFDHYFKTRDFTINQSLVLNNQLYVSELAQNDFIENVIRPTYYELPCIDESLSSRLFLKAMMMKTVLAEVTSSVPLVEDIGQVGEIKTFDLALMLNKTISRGASIARGFTANLVDWGIVDEEYFDHPLALARDVRKELSNFVYYPSSYEDEKENGREIKKSLPKNKLKSTNNYLPPDSMFSYHASDPKIKQAISEYEDIDQNINIEDDRRNIYDEPEYGQYSEYDYEYINNDEEE